LTAEVASQSPRSIAIEYWDGADWQPVVDPVAEAKVNHAAHGQFGILSHPFKHIEKVRAVFTHDGGARSGRD